MADFNFFLNSQGARGRKGEKGEQGFSPVITVYEQTATSYRLQIETLDGTYVTPNLLPAIQDAGGTVLQFDREQEQYFLGDLPSATDEIEGLVRMASEEDLNIVSETGAVTPIGVFTVAGKTIEAGTDNVHIDVDNENTKIIISVDKNSEYVLPVATTTTLGGIKPDNQTIVTDPVTGETHVNLDEIGNELNTLSSKVNKIDEDVLILDGLLIDTQGDVETLQDDVSGINTTISGIEGNIQGLDTRVTNLENKELPDNVYTADNLKSGTNVTFRKVGNETYIDAVGSGEAVDAYTKQETDDLLATRDTRITNVESEVADVKGTIESHTESITTIESNIADINNNKQNKLVAGENINIDPETNTISATSSEGKEYKAGVGMELTGGDTFDISRTTPQYVENFTKAYGPAITPEGTMTISWGRGVKLSMPTALDMSKQWTLDFDYTPAGGGGNVFSFLDSSSGEFAQFYPSISSNTMTACWYATNKDGTSGGNGQIPTANYVTLGTQYVHIEYTGHSMIFKVGSIKGTNNIVDYELTEYQQSFEPFYGNRPLKDLKTIFIGYYINNPKVDTSNYGIVPLRNFKFTHDGNIYTPYIQTGNAILASDTELGLVQVDGTTIVANDKGVISVKGGIADPDNVTIERNEEGKLQTTVDINAIQNRVEDVETKVDNLQLYKFPNATIVGEPTINNGQVSNFSNTNFLKFPFEFETKGRTWLLHGSFDTDADVTTQQNIIDSLASIALAVRDSKLVLALSSNGTSFNLGEHLSTSAIEPSTKYFYTMLFDNTHYSLSLSTDKQSWSQEIEVVSSEPIASKSMTISSPNHPFKGVLNLNDWDLTVGQTLVWQGMDDVGIASRMDVNMSNATDSAKQMIKNLAAEVTPTIHVATTETTGIVKPDGTSITIDEDGTLHSQGGGAGASNYNDLTNKPTINTMELKGELALGGALKIERASTDAFYNSSRNSSNQLVFSVASGYFNKAQNNDTFISGAGGLKINSDGTITPSSYFMMPYKLGDIISCGKGKNDEDLVNAYFGYKINGKFKPVIKATPTRAGSAYPFLATSFLNTFQRYADTYYKNENLYTSTSITPDLTYTDSSTYPETNTNSYYMETLVYDESLGLYKSYYKSKNSFYEYQYSTTMNEELQKIDTVIVLYRYAVSTPSVYTNFEIKDGSTVTDNFFTSMTYPEVMALPSIEVPEVIEHNVLSTGNIPNSYIGLDEKPKINGNELVGNINSTDLNIQRVMTPNGGINIVQNGDWYFFDASYDDTTKQITFDRYNLYTSSSNYAYIFDNKLNSTTGSKIGTYVDAEKIIPTCGIITPFYKNVTWKFGYANYSVGNRLVFGNYINGYFYPKYAICPPFGDISAPNTHFIKVSRINGDSTSIFSYTNVPVSSRQLSSKDSRYYMSPVAFITILYDNNTYTFKYTNSTYSNYSYYLKAVTVTNDTEGLNSCTHCWHIPNTGYMGYDTYTQLATGDWSLDCFNSQMSNTKLNDSLILPDSGSNVFTTSISVKTDNVTTRINSSGQLEAIAPANMITTDNIASDATINTMNSNITTLTENMGGVKLVKITQTNYDALATKDENTLYIVSGDTSTTIYIGSVQIQ